MARKNAVDVKALMTGLRVPIGNYTLRRVVGIISRTTTEETSN